MKLFTYWRSSSSWRVRIALHHKGIKFDSEAVHLLRDGGEQHHPAYLKRNALARVPALQFPYQGKEATLCESLAIMELLEEVQPVPSLLPKDIFLRGKVRQLAQVINSSIQPLQNVAVLQAVQELGGDRSAWARRWMHHGLQALEHETTAWGGRCCVGDAVTMADVCLAPQMAAARRFELDLAAYPTLSRIDAALATLPAFVAAHAQNQSDAPPGDA